MRTRTIDSLEPWCLSGLVHEALPRHHSKETCTEDLIASMPGEENYCMSTSRDHQLKKEGGGGGRGFLCCVVDNHSKQTDRLR